VVGGANRRETLVAVEEMFVSRIVTPPHGFTDGIEGPACDADGMLYAVNYERQHTIGRVEPDGACSVFVELQDGSIGNGIVFDRAGRMFVADYTNHNVLLVDMATRESSVWAHEPRMHQPNDLAITSGGVLFASDPDWATSTGRLWRIGTDRRVTLLESGMGTTNGIEVSPDERTLYVNESVQRRVWGYDLTPEGWIGAKRLLIEFPDYGLDGMRCDVGGALYIARHGKGVIAKLSPQGEMLSEVELAGVLPTNVAFGGSDGRTCFVTLADRGNIESFRTDLPGRSWALWQTADSR